MNKFKFFVLCLLAICSLAGPVSAVVVEQMETNSIPQKISSSTPLFVTVTGASGSGTSTATFDLVLPSVNLATRSITVLATDTITLLQNIASFTDGDLIMFQGRSKFYWSVLSGTSGTAAQMQAGAYSAEAGDTPVQFHLRTTANLAFVADPASIATLTYTIIKER